MNHEEAQKLLIAIGRRVEATFPTWPGEKIHAAAQALASSGAYEVVFDGLRSTGQPEAMRAAQRACPEFVHAFARSSVTDITDPHDRADARIRAMTGVGLSEALANSWEDANATPQDFMGLHPKGAA